jgi:hypothetical protein
MAIAPEVEFRKPSLTVSPETHVSADDAIAAAAVVSAAAAVVSAAAAAVVSVAAAVVSTAATVVSAALSDPQPAAIKDRAKTADVIARRGRSEVLPSIGNVPFQPHGYV